jgi:ABC-type bacteriocin/lantibiotic exporter with double-glycine peptidase domain
MIFAIAMCMIFPGSVTQPACRLANSYTFPTAEACKGRLQEMFPTLPEDEHGHKVLQDKPEVRSEWFCVQKPTWTPVQ